MPHRPGSKGAPVRTPSLSGLGAGFYLQRSVLGDYPRISFSIAKNVGIGRKDALGASSLLRRLLLPAPVLGLASQSRRRFSCAFCVGADGRCL